MADNSLDDIVLGRIYRDDLEENVAKYVLRALDGTLDEFIEGDSDKKQPSRPATPQSPAGANLRRVSVTGFRGIGPPADLDVVPGPGLTLVVGANGTGKSSFAEGLEFLLTGRNSRWQDKSAEWRHGWRNLHAQDPPELQAVFAVDGKTEETLVSRRWHSTDATRIEDHALEGLDALEWASALETHRPFLSYDQLSDIVEKGPSARFDAMAAGLGLERLTDARERLRHQRLTDQRMLREAQQELDRFQADLDALDDERGRAVRTALENEPWDLEAVILVLEGVLGEDADRPLNLLRRLTTLDFPSAEDIEECCRKLREVHTELQEFKGSNAARAALLQSALEVALLVHKYEGDQPCPVCGEGSLDDHWKVATVERTFDLADEWVHATRMSVQLSDAFDRVGELCKPMPDWLSNAGQVGIDASAVTQAWNWWSRALTDEPGLPRVETRDVDEFGLPWHEKIPKNRPVVRIRLDEVDQPKTQEADQPKTQKVDQPKFQWGMDIGADFAFINTLTDQGMLEVAGRLTERGAQVRTALESLRERAGNELDRRENQWRPLRRQLLEWLPVARRGQRAATRMAPTQAAADWLANVEDDVRAERFRPIADRARRFWETMGKGSSVALDDLTLAGQANRRHLDIATSVDGRNTPALAVMSQGELNALSLSLFLARALLPESPFRFLVIDDPVQAMDPTKVEGLARVLAEAAEERQVIVFTHDERLSATVHRLRIEHKLLAVTRHENSQVQCQPVQEPVRRHLGDARAVWLTDPLDDNTRQRVIPGFCRQALEAACVEAVWRARTSAGCDYARTEQDVTHAQTLNDKLKLVLLDDLNGNHQDMRNALYQRFGTRARDVVDACNRGAHGHWRGGMDGLIDGTEWLAKRILTQVAP